MFAGRDAVHGMLGEADIVSLHVPLTPETRHLIDGPALAAMRSSAILVNTARGLVVDERALVEALRAGTIAGAALDVFEREPQVELGLLSLENVVLTPHLGSATRDTRVAIDAMLDAGAFAAWLSGSGPSAAAFADPDDATRVAGALPGEGRVLVLEIDDKGAVIT